MRKSAHIFFVYLLSGFIGLNSQTTCFQMTVEDVVEELVAAGTEFDHSRIYDDLTYFTDNPLNLNTATRDQLHRLYILNDIQITNLLDYIGEYGKMASVHELGYVDGFTGDIILKILPFVTTEEAQPYLLLPERESLRYGRHQIFLRAQGILQQQKGYRSICDSVLAQNPNSRYLGGPLKLYTRYQYNLSNRIYWGFVAEKDSGEEMFTGSNPYGMDYHSFHFQINDAGRLRTLALGDYRMQFGQGLVLWSGFSFGKSAASMNIAKNPRGIQKYSSTDENMFMRGVGATYGVTANTDLSLFFSRKKIDARVSAADTTGNILEVSSLPNTGLHATPSQVENKNVLGETIFGGDITYNHKNFKVGVTALHYFYSAPFNRPLRQYNQFVFRGRENINIGFNYRFNYYDISFFGEIAAGGRGMAMLTGVLWDLSPGLNVAVLYRDYDRDYHAWYGSAFSESTSPVNEKGIYLGAEVYLPQGIKVSAYYDNYSFPWLRYGAYAPSAGTDFLVQADYTLSRNVQMYARLRHRSKPVNSPVGYNNVRYLMENDNTRIRYHIAYNISPSVEFRNRIEFARYKTEQNASEKGFLIYHDIIYNPSAGPLSFAFRYGLFDTDSYNARIYAYENDVLYGFSFPAYFDSGYRTYITARYGVSGSVDLWLRYATTLLPGRTTMGSGLDEIDGNRRSQAKAQIRIRF